jgi:phosphoglycerate dehydrogenase-like enzyme
MKLLNVLVISSIDEACKKEIRDVSPRISLVDGTHIWDARHILTGDESGAYSRELDLLLADAEVIYGRRPPPDMLSRAPKLKWFQTFLAGVDHFLDEELIRSPIKITNMSGLHTNVAEAALSIILMFSKRAPFILENKRQRKWVRYDPMAVEGSTVGIVGLGKIGKNIARLCKAFGMNVLATRRSAKAGDAFRYVDKIFPMSDLKVMLSKSDFVVSILPSTPETDKMFGEKEFMVMRQSSFFINMGRGNAVDEEALIRALSEGWISGAGLDAYEVDPLPLESMLWDLPDVILFPHVSGRMKNYEQHINRIFCENLDRYIHGKRLKNLVDKKKGY